MTSNPPSTRSTANDDRIAALEVSDHSIRRQIKVQGEEFAKEFTDIKESVDFPQFNGEDPTGWIYKAEKFFRYQRTENSEKITLASFHLLDDALQWYQWFEKTRTDVSWEEFTRALCVRFGPSNYEDFDEALAKLHQTSTVREYQENFERLAARVQDWPGKALVGGYIGGLREEIHAKVK
ncbi:uncharacterized protein LOC142612122 [Castanea sativa]|uniref:uncharacterized protein LOC142612122 n=1 Tax=Castanea sativa TaxID=21020 RepID=UPI003F652F36